MTLQRYLENSWIRRHETSPQEIGELLAIADIVTKQYAVCVICSAFASKSYRLTSVDENQVFVGANESYEARCRSCHYKGVSCQ